MDGYLVTPLILNLLDLAHHGVFGLVSIMLGSLILQCMMNLSQVVPNIFQTINTWWNVLDMTVQDYGKGLLMTCEKSNPLYGTKYLETGFWNKKLKGWVFRRQDLDYLIEQDAVYVSDNVEVSEQENSQDMPNFENMNFQEHGRGYLLYPCGDPREGTKYFHEGYWNSTLKGLDIPPRI